jgi:hypothetical protein
MSGWGRFTWGQAYWGEDDLLATGWGAKPYGTSNWGDLSGEVVSLTGLQINSTLNPSVTFDISGLVEPLGIAATFSIGSITNVIDVTTSLTGEEITSAQGTITTEISVTPTITGQEIPTALGVIDPADQVIGLTGQEFNVVQGTAVAPNEDVPLLVLKLLSSRNSNCRYHYNH